MAAASVDPQSRQVAEFCKSGAKAVAWEATTRSLDGAFFARHSIPALHDLVVRFERP